MLETSVLRDNVIWMAETVDRAWDESGSYDDIFPALEELRMSLVEYKTAQKANPIITITELRNRFPIGTEFFLSNDLEAKSSSHAWVLEITPNLDKMKETWPWPMGLAFYGSTEERCLLQAHKALVLKKR